MSNTGMCGYNYKLDKGESITGLHDINVLKKIDELSSGLNAFF